MLENFHVLLAQNPGLLATFVGLLSLIVGSFLNVVIYRLPAMMKQDWREECCEFLQLAPPEKEEKLNLLTPRSRCQYCQSTLSWWQNIPILSYLLLRGKCYQCQSPISWRYPAVETLTLLLSICVVWQFGYSYLTLYALILTWGLIAISLIDIDHQFIPDTITLSLLWLGLLINLYSLFCPIQTAIIGAVAGYMSLWLFTHLFKLITGKVGMGHGDFKLLALFGAWLGWQVLLFILIFASLIGALVGLLLIASGRQDRQAPIPFGPFLAASGWSMMLWGDSIASFYWQLMAF